MKNAAIALEDGTIFYGRSFGADGIRDGEVVFNTSMTGYQEILTDPSYKGQIVTMTTPQIGNYGINPADNESWMPQVEGFIVKEISPVASNFRSREELSAFLKRHNIIAIQGVDTRALTRHIRIGGAIKAVVSTVDITPEILIEKAKSSPGLIGRDLVKEVTTDKIYEFKKDPADMSSVTGRAYSPPEDTGLTVVVIDFGLKENIPLSLIARGIRVKVVPAGYPGRRRIVAQARRNTPFQRAGGPRGGSVCHRRDKKAHRQETDLRHLPGPSALGAGPRRRHL